MSNLPTPFPEAVAVDLITGFLGSGKTTLINRLIKQPEMQNCAVLVNEFGEIGIDHLLIEAITENIVLVESGCICCEVRGDLISSLIDLYERVLSSEITPFQRIFIETSGVSDPLPVIQILTNDTRLSRWAYFNRTITVFDAVFGTEQLPRHNEVKRQLALADHIVVSKSDLVPEPQENRIISLLRDVNKVATISTASTTNADLTHIIKASVSAESLSKAFDHTTANESLHEFNGAASVESKSIVIEDPIKWPVFLDWVNSIIFSRGENVLRIKGILHIHGETAPIAINGIQNLFWRSRLSGVRPDHVGGSKLVIITYQMSSAAVEKSLRDFLAEYD